MALANILLVEDDSFAATTLEAALLLAGFSVAVNARNAKQALVGLRASEPDVAVLDIDLGPGPTGVDLAYALREEKPQIGLVFLTSFYDPRLSKSGSLPLPRGSRYLTKSEVNDLRNLGSVILRAKYQPLANLPAEKLNSPLSLQQIEVLKLVASGATNTEIANQLGVTEKAVEHLVTRIAKSLKIKRSAEHNLRVQLVRAYSELTGKSLPTS